MNKVSFIYEGTEYPFDISIFIKYSNYISKKYKEIQKNGTKFIYLISEFDNCPQLQNESIEDFIKYCQNQKIELTIYNVIQINFLSNKYDVPKLIEKTDKFINTHIIEIANNFLSNKTLIDSTNSYYEEIISYHISLFFEGSRLLDLPISSLYRIIMKYAAWYNQPNQTDNCEFQLIKFLTKCIQKHGANASFLLKLFNLGPKSCDYLIEKLTENPDLLDFQFAKSLMFRSIHFINVREKQNDHLNKQKLNVECIRSNCISVFNELFNMEYFKRTDTKIDVKNSMNFSEMKFAVMFAIRSIFNKLNVDDDESFKLSFDKQNNEVSKFDFLFELFNSKLFSESHSLLLGNNDYSKIISLVSKFKSEQTKHSIESLFKFIENKNESII